MGFRYESHSGLYCVYKVQKRGKRDSSLQDTPPIPNLVIKKIIFQ